MEGCLNREWDPMLPGCGGTGGSTWDVALSSPGFARSTRPSQSAIGPWDWGFHTVRGGVDPGELDFRPRGVGVVDISKDVCTGDGSQSSSGAAGLPRVMLARPSQSAIGKWHWGFHTVRGGVDPGEIDFRPRGVGVIEIWKDV